MADPSSISKKIVHVFVQETRKPTWQTNSYSAPIAAVLRTAASKVAEEFTPGQSTWGEGYYEGACRFNEYLKEIASELEGFN